MPNEFDLNPNFINPGYATPQQVEQLRNYANQLQAASIAPTSTSWTGALAQALMGLSAATNANRANQLQKTSLQQTQEGLSRVPLPPNIPSNIGYVPQGSPGSAWSPTSRNETVGSASNTSQNELSPYAGAIASIESGGRYNEVGPVTRNGDRAVGKYQVMARDVPQRTQKYLGVAMTPQQFLNDPQAQEKEFAAEFGELVQKYGPSGAARAWFAGEGGMNNPRASDGYLTVAQYENKFNNAMRAKGTNVAQNLIPPSSYAYEQINPWVPESTKQSMQNWATPRVVGTDPYGQPLMASPYGLNAQAPAGGFKPSYPATVTASPQAVTVPTMMSPGGAGGSLGAGVRQSVEEATKLGQSIGRQGAANTAVMAQIAGDVKAGGIAPQQLQILKMVEDDIKSHPNMFFGPSADALTNWRALILQHARGLLPDGAAADAAAQDLLNKSTAQLQAFASDAVGGGGTDVARLQGFKMVPGAHNNREGAIAIIDMLKQQYGQNARILSQLVPHIGDEGYDYMAERNKFFNAKENQLINPITKHPISVDVGGLQGSQTLPQTQQYRIIKRTPKQSM